SSLTPFVGRETPEEKRWHAITDYGDISRDVFNVFSVWDFIHTGDDHQFEAYVQCKTRISNDEMVKSGSNFNMCMMKDKKKILTGPAGIFAHEAGHYLEGYVNHYRAGSGSNMLNLDKLMREAGPHGWRLTKRDAEAMNR